MVTSTPPTGFEAQFQAFINYAGPILQLLFWLVVGFSAIYAALQFKRYVDFMTGSLDMTGGDDVLVDDETAAGAVAGAASPKIDVDKFVE